MKIILEIWKDKSGGPALGIISAVSSIFSLGNSLGLFGGEKKEKAPPPPTVLDAVPDKADPKRAVDQSRRRAAAAVGRGKTVLTSPLGAEQEKERTARTILLGK